MAISQIGQGVKKTNVPLWKMLIGYLNRISNMKSTSREHGVDCVDVIVVAGSYKQSQDVGKFDMRAHFRESPRIWTG